MSKVDQKTFKQFLLGNRLIRDLTKGPLMSICQYKVGKTVVAQYIKRKGSPTIYHIRKECLG